MDLCHGLWIGHHFFLCLLLNHHQQPTMSFLTLFTVGAIHMASAALITGNVSCHEMKNEYTDKGCCGAPESTLASWYDAESFQSLYRKSENWTKLDIEFKFFLPLHTMYQIDQSNGYTFGDGQIDTSCMRKTFNTADCMNMTEEGEGIWYKGIHIASFNYVNDPILLSGVSPHTYATVSPRFSARTASQSPPTYIDFLLRYVGVAKYFHPGTFGFTEAFSIPYLSMGIPMLEGGNISAYGDYSNIVNLVTAVNRPDAYMRGVETNFQQGHPHLPEWTSVKYEVVISPPEFDWSPYPSILAGADPYIMKMPKV